MSIRYKIFGVFSILIVLACGLAFYGIRGISSSGDLVVRLRRPADGDQPRAFGACLAQ